MSKNDGGPAFPTSVSADGPFGGLTVRQWYAGQALAGLMANPGGPIQNRPDTGWGLINCTPDTVADFAYGLADALLAHEQQEGEG